MALVVQSSAPRDSSCWRPVSVLVRHSSACMQRLSEQLGPELAGRLDWGHAQAAANRLGAQGALCAPGGPLGTSQRAYGSSETLAASAATSGASRSDTPLRC